MVLQKPMKSLLRAALAQTDAPLPDVRKFMAEAADGFGY